MTDQATPEPTAAPPPPPGYAPVAWGPPGRQRSIGTSILLAIVTLGIYTYVWTWQTHEEIKRHSGQGVGGALGFVIYFMFSPVTWFLLPSEIEKMLKQAGRRGESASNGFFCFFPHFGAFLCFPKVQGQLNEYWQSLGVTA